MSSVIRWRKGVMAIPPDVKRKAVRRYRHMEPGRQQAVRSDKKGWERDSARSASFNAHYGFTLTFRGVDSRQGIQMPQREIAKSDFRLEPRKLTMNPL